MDLGDTLQALAFYGLAGMTVVSALVVAASQNIVRSAFALLATLFGIAGLYALAGADFLAGIQLLVYVGGILVLILFAVMLTHRISNIHLSNESTPGWLAFLLTGWLFAILAIAVARTHWPLFYLPGATTPGKFAMPQAERIGFELMGDYLLPFEVVSVLLVAALVGAAYVARKEIREK